MTRLRSRTQNALLAATLVLVAAVAAPIAATVGAGSSSLTAAQAAAPMSAPSQDAAPIPPADELVLFAPRLGGDFHERRCQCFAEPDGVRCTCEAPDQGTASLAPYSGLSIQNAGEREARYIAAYFDSPVQGAPDACEDCTLVGWSCSERVPIGGTYSFPPYWSGAETSDPLAPTFAAAAVVYSLSTREARAYGQEWEDWLVESGLPADTRLDEIACMVLTGEPSGPGPGHAALRDSQAEPDACEAYSAFHSGFTTDAEDPLPGTELPVAPLRGEPVSGVATVLDSGSSGTSPALDRYVAMELPEVGRSGDSGPASHVYVAPGGYGAMQDGTKSALMVQNAGTACAEVSVQPHRSRFGPSGDALRLRLPPGARRTVRVADTWPGLANAMVTLVVEGDQPLASTLVNLNYATSANHGAHLARESTVRWLVPRAYQEERQVSQELLATGGVSVHQSQPAGADGWETNLAVYNPHPESRDVFMRMQATGEPPRGPISYPIEGLAQRVLQPGFGLGLQGGPGWMEMTSNETPMYVSVESLRQASDIPLTVAAWSVGAWSHEDGSAPTRAIAFPDLGGPALGPALGPELELPSDPAQALATITSTLSARLSVQNPATRTTAIAIDTYHETCGYVGTVDLSIDPRQTLVVPVSELPGTRSGANSAFVRVLAGEAAAVLETITHDRQAASSDAPPNDVSNAYRGGRLSTQPPVPEAVTVTMSITPTAIGLTRPDAVTRRTVAIDVAPAIDRCVSFDAVSDSEWLTAIPSAGLAPGTLVLEIDPEQLGPGETFGGTVTVTADQPGVAGSPQAITVVVTDGGQGALYVPVAWAPERTAR